MQNVSGFTRPLFTQQDLFDMVGAAVRAAGLTPKLPPVAARAFKPRVLKSAATRRKNASASTQLAMDLTVPAERRNREVCAQGRKCLKCRRSFVPKDRLNFVCCTCKRTDVWVSAGSSFAALLLLVAVTACQSEPVPATCAFTDVAGHPTRIVGDGIACSRGM